MVQWVTIATKFTFLCSCDPTCCLAQKEPQMWGVESKAHSDSDSPPTDT